MTVSERIGDAIFDYGMVLPLTVTADSESRLVRMLGIPWFFVWILPAGLICGIPLILCLLGVIVEESWTGT